MMESNQTKLLRYYALMDSFCETLIFLSPDGTYLDGHLGDTLQKTEPNLVGLSIFQIFPNLIPQLQSALDALNSRESSQVCFYFGYPDTNKHYEARLGWAGCEILLYITDMSHVPQLVHNVEPDYQTTLRELKRSNLELEQFAYAASHDLREPLNKIRSFLRLFAELYKVDQQGQQYMDIILSASDRMARLIDELLIYSRVGRAKESVQEMDLEAVIRKLWSEIETPPEAKIKLAGLLPVLQEGTQLEMLFQNLLSNAVKFRHPARPLRISITAQYTDDTLEIEFEDNGIGFDPKYKDKIFGLFERLHSRFEIPGTGIGLALCKRIARNHHGDISAEGCPDQGAIFHLTLPLLRKVK